MSNPERDIQSPKNPTRIVNGREFKLVTIPPEDPQIVRERDKIRPDIIGSKPMVIYYAENTLGKKAPRSNTR